MPYQERGQGQADQNYQSLFGSQQPWAQGAPGQIIPNLYADASAIQNNPYAAGAQQGANQFGAWATGTGAPQMQAGSTSLNQQGGQLAGAIPGVLQQGNDPQNALYNQTSQQTLDQQNAINAMSGVSGSPYSAGLDAQNAQNFNLAWGNNQLGRMQTADSTAGGLSSGSQGAYSGAGSLADSATQLGAYGSSLPYNTANTAPSAGLNAWNQAAGGVSSALAPGGSLMGDLGNYLTLGQNSTRIGQAGQQQRYTQNQQEMQQLGQLLSQLTGGNPFQAGGQGYDIGDLFGQGGLFG
jgi:hypothetical protein